MDYSKLTPEEKAELKAHLEAEEKAKQQQIQEDRETYKTLVDKFVVGNVKMMLIKKNVFESAELLIDMKDDLYKTKADRRSNTFTTQDGLMSITLGNRIN